MSVVVIQYEDRRYDYMETLMDRTRMYCERHGYRYVRPTTKFHVSPWWIKVMLVKQWMPEAEYIVWIDSDAVVDKQNIRIEDMIPANKDFVISYDFHDLTKLGMYVANTGVFILRVNETTKRLMEDWWKCYNPERWYIQNGRWKTSGKWAGPDYEQGSFNTTILPRYKDAIHVYEPEILGCNTTFPSERAFVCHFCLARKKSLYIPLYLIASRRNELMFWTAVLGVTVYFGFRKK